MGGNPSTANSGNYSESLRVFLCLRTGIGTGCERVELLKDVEPFWGAAAMLLTA